jgi:uncharacterized protein
MGGTALMNDQPNDELLQEPVIEPASEENIVVCWRCGLPAEALAAKCVHCGARLAAEEESPRPAARTTDSDERALMRTMVVFMLVLATSVVSGLVTRYTAPASENADPSSQKLVLSWTLILEAIDTLMVLGALAWIRVRFRFARKPFFQRFLIGVGFLFLLVGILAVNFSYHRFLREVLHVPLLDTDLLSHRNFIPLWLFAICIQPAVIEELFFRYLVLGVLRSALGVHAAVFVTAIMFGIAHIGVPLSMPVLFVLGLLLGYARAASGGMFLPIFMHFLHNLIIIMLTHAFL